MKKAALAAALPAIAAFAALTVSEIRLPGHRGADLVAEGFKPGRWDAAYRVARGPAALRLPAEPLVALARISGPATIEGLGQVGAEPTALAVPAGERVPIVADGTIRLHEVTLARRQRPYGLLLLAVAAALVPLVFAVRRGTTTAAPGAAAADTVRPSLAGAGVIALSLAIAAGTVAASPFARLAIRGFWARTEAGLVVVALGLGALALLALPRKALPTVPGGLPKLAAAAVLVSALVQTQLFPQPLVAGDPATYHDIAGRFRDAVGSVRSLDELAESVHVLRPYGGLAFVGALYGLLRGVADDVRALYAVHALALAAAAFFLTRCAVRAGGRTAGAIAVVLVATYAPWPIVAGIVQPEPFVLALWCAALDRLLATRQTPSPRDHAGVGLLFALGLALHPQGIWYLFAAVVLALLPFAPHLLPHRRALATIALGAAPVALACSLGERWAAPAAHVLDERHGFFTYSAPVPLGFWLFVDSDGWQGPRRIDDNDFAHGLLAERHAGEAHMLPYTVRFALARPGACARTVLRNLDRLFRLPDNPFQRDWLLPYDLQVDLHRAAFVLFLLAAPLLLRHGAGAALVPVAILAATYPLYHVFNKYATPATPFVLLGAALAIPALARTRVALVPLALAAAAALAGPLPLVYAGVSPGTAHALVLALQVGSLATAWLVTARVWAAGGPGWLVAVAAAFLLLVRPMAAAWDDPAWQRYAVPLDGRPSHEIHLSEAEMREIHAAREAYVALDLHLPGGDPSAISLTMAGQPVPATRLQPTMPLYGLATTRGNRDPRSLPQWWRLALDPAWIAGGRLDVTIAGPHEATLAGDMDVPAGAGADHGLSLGEWPHLSVYRLMHEGEYRLATRYELAGSRASRTAAGPLPGALGVRIVVVDPRGTWTLPPAPNVAEWQPASLY